MEAEATFDRRRRLLFHRMSGDQRRVEIDHHRILGCGCVVWGMFPGQRPALDEREVPRFQDTPPGIDREVGDVGRR